MNLLGNTSSFVTGSFYPSVSEPVAFHVSGTQLSESRTRMRVDCLSDRQMWPKIVLFTAIIGLIATIVALFTTILEFPALWNTSWLAICIAFVVSTFMGVFSFCYASSGITEAR
jgi:uncharacterized membrane protein YbhN (UPF0104 family)